MARLNREPVLAGLLIAGILFGAIAWDVIRAQQEAAAYERVTGKKVSTWDAMFLDLRVQESPK